MKFLFIILILVVMALNLVSASDDCFFQQTLNKGWNTVTLTIQPENTAITGVLSSIDGSYKNVWANVNGKWLSYSPTVLPSTSTLKYLNKDMTFQIEMSQDATLIIENCNNNDRWYDTGNTRFVSTGQCTEKQQKEQEYRDYKCNSGCTYSITSTQWIDIGIIQNKANGVSCDDSLYCNGIERCVDGQCKAGIPPVTNDNIACTADSCNEVNDVIVHAPQNNLCNNGAYCDGAETCTLSGCQAGNAINCNDNLFCTVNDRCDENLDKCIYDQKDCSGNNLPGINKCNDNNPWILDFRSAFTSSCDETNDKCTTGSEAITSTCNRERCNAECSVNSDCVNKYIGNIYYYNGVCSSCLCVYQTQNSNSYVKPLDSINFIDKNGVQIEDEIYNVLEKENQIKVIVMLKDVAYKRADIGSNINFKYKYNNINAFFGILSRSDLQILENSPDVERIYLDRKVYASLLESTPLINANSAWNFGYTGKGQTICIIDTGVDYSNPDLGGCFGENCKVIGGYDFVNNDNDPMDDYGHGTHIAGIIASKNSLYKGVAPDAKIVAVKVLNEKGEGSFSDVVAALDYCIDNKDKYGISIISMSLGDIGEYNDPSVCDKYADAVAIKKAFERGIFVDVASGNNGYTNGIAYPACASKAVSVGAVYDNNFGSKEWCIINGLIGCAEYCNDNANKDSLACFTNRDEMLDLLAPGAIIKSVKIGGGFIDMSGTSMAAPFVAGVAALMLEKDPYLTPGDIENKLKTSGVSIKDKESGLSFPRIDAFNALDIKKNVEVPEEFISVTLEGYPIDFGGVVEGSKNNPAKGNLLNQYKIKINPETDVYVDIYQRGSDLIKWSNNIPVNNIMYNTINNVNGAVKLNNNYEKIFENKVLGIYNLYYWISVPSNKENGTYVSDIFIKVVKSGT